MDYTSIIGIDVAADKLDICFSSNQNEDNLFSSIQYNEKALDYFLAENKYINNKTCIVAMESTGDYHIRAAKYFLEKGFKVKIINPILTKKYTNATIRGTKTDKTDSEIICKLIQQGDGADVNLKDLQNTAKELLRLSSTLKKYAKGIKQRLATTRRKNLDGTKKVEAKLENIIEQIQELSEFIVDEATQERTTDEELIDTIPGFATKLSAIVYHELGDVTRFENIKNLCAYAGLDPKIKQSGNNLNTYGKLTKRGSPMLRTSLFIAANVARQHDKELKEYYQKKRGENRSHKEVLCIISRKLLARIMTVLKEQRPYIKSV